MASDVRMVWDSHAIAALKTDPEVTEYTTRVAEDFAATFRRVAPKRTGEGATSIQVRVSGAAGARRVGWDKEHLYMGYQELGTKYVRALRFATKALNEYKHD